MSDDNIHHLHPSIDDVIENMCGPNSSGFPLVMEGRLIRGIRVRPLPDGVDLVVDGRFCVTVPKELAMPVAYVLAQAMAVGAGYVPFAPKLMKLSGLEPLPAPPEPVK